MTDVYVKRNNESFNANPWVGDLAATIVTKNKITGIGKSDAVIDMKTGELSDSASVAIVSREVMDKEQFVKVFQGGISNIFNLSKSAKDLFQAMLQIYINQTFQSDRVYLSKMSLSEVGYTRTRVTKNNALNQLLKLDFIAQTSGDKSWFWVNPSMFFKGNRMTMVREFAVKGTSDGDAMSKKMKSIKSESNQMKLI